MVLAHEKSRREGRVSAPILGNLARLALFGLGTVLIGVLFRGRHDLDYDAALTAFQLTANPINSGRRAHALDRRLVCVDWHPANNWRQPSAVLTLNHVRNVAWHAAHLTTLRTKLWRPNLNPPLWADRSS
jgi:hypothetical protein